MSTAASRDLQGDAHATECCTATSRRGGRGVLLALVSPLVCLLSLACGGREGSVVLGLKYREGAIQRVGLQTQVDVNLTIGDRQIPVSLAWELDLEIVVNHVDANGVADVTAHIESFDLSRRGGPALGRDQGALRYFHALVTTLARMFTEFPRNFRIDPSGRLVEPQDRADFFELLLPMFPLLPAREVKTGTTFASEISFMVPVLGVLDIDQRSRFDSIRSGDVCRIVTELTARTPDTRRLRTLGVDLDILTFEQSGGGTFDVMPERGELVRRDLALDFNVKLVPSEPRELVGAPVKVYIHFSHTLRSRR